MIRIGRGEINNVNYVPSHSTERIILKSLMDDPLIYSYQSVGELEFEITLRKNIIESSKAMDQGQAEFEVFAHSRCNPKYWNRTITGGFSLRGDVLPSEAIQDIYLNSSLYGFECATAMLIVYYHAVLNTIGDQHFNRLFRGLYLYSWHSDSDLRLQTVDTDHLIPGDVVYFRNPDVSPETRWWQGENAVVLEDGRFFGHGIGITSAEQIIESLNRHRRPGSRRSAFMIRTITRPHFKYLARVTSMREDNVHKPQNPVIHHDDPSIPTDKYQYFLIMHLLNK
ncbi:protein-glutamine gamma-glutamyltransferase [Piscibacillus halophilus]|uniref:Protein-glutamine gamma-glutamyltransferase n=1 Tax=Piscibacillus halophilus TaxID=571933 RepID=A0A1H9ICJ4_9BACI|nr:protein-glutamine gamma-glutamyltransferase [Piscibacillus halophilus]SEQ72307.1 protein-glutamine gamma-glutamyltransferase [Piscibacillus halophilus]